MRARRSSFVLALCCLSLLTLGADRCPLHEIVADVEEMVEGIVATLADHDDRLGDLEACTCCCDGRFELVCGDDGHTYLNECEAGCVGVAVESEGQCQPGSECDEPNPAGCVQTGCPDGEVCFRDGTQCIPSACTCDGETGTWICTDDCGGGVCIGGPGECSTPNPAGCSATNPCPSGEVCFRDGTQCLPSACMCDAATDSWICTDDCGGGVCIGGPGECSTPNPAGCSATNPCPSGEVCFRDGTQCLPSACMCDAATGSWICTKDCGGGLCVGPPRE